MTVSGWDIVNLYIAAGCRVNRVAAVALFSGNRSPAFELQFYTPGRSNVDVGIIRSIRPERVTVALDKVGGQLKIL